MKKTITTILCLVFLSSCGPARVDTPTATASPSITPSVTAYITPAVTPDLGQPVIAAMARIDELAATNGGCEYPCFWGITPGVTTLDEARQIIEPLTYTPAPVLDEQGNGVWDVCFYDNTGGLAAGFEDLQLLISEGAILTVRYDPGTLAIWQVLTELGQPQEIFYHFSALDYPLFSPTLDLILLNPARGMAAHLVFSSGFEVVDEETMTFQLAEGMMISETTEYFFFPAGYEIPQTAYIETLMSGGNSYGNIRDGLGRTPEEFMDSFGDYQLDDGLEFTQGD